jgi:multimeric flavodoxin WrbA
LKEIGKQGADGEIVRLVDLNIEPGVTSDEGESDDWPALRQRILNADIFILGTPIWLGHPSSLCQRVLERLDAFLGEQDESGRIVSYDRVACVAVVGNEDGAHHVFAELAQGLSDVGFTIPAEGSVYWVGEAMQAVDFKDKSPTPEATATATTTLARNAAHLARVLKADAYPSE